MTSFELRTQTIAPVLLSRDERDRMYALMTESYEHVGRSRFESDLLAKDTVILLRENMTGRIVGFSTQVVFTHAFEGNLVRGIFSGDTVVAEAFRGTQALVRAWFRFAGEVLSRDPQKPLYWLLISKGYRTYLYLPLFFRHYSPAPGVQPDDITRRLMDTIARNRFGEVYDSTAGVLRFSERIGNLTSREAAIPTSRRDDALVDFFLQKNPGYASGDELVCLARISPENTRGLARTLLMRGMAGSTEATA